MKIRKLWQHNLPGPSPCGQTYVTESRREKMRRWKIVINEPPFENWGMGGVQKGCKAKASDAVMKKCGFRNVYSGIGLYQDSDREIIKNVWVL